MSKTRDKRLEGPYQGVKPWTAQPIAPPHQIEPVMRQAGGDEPVPIEQSEEGIPISIVGQENVQLQQEVPVVAAQLTELATPGANTRVLCATPPGDGAVSVGGPNDHTMSLGYIKIRDLDPRTFMEWTELDSENPSTANYSGMDVNEVGLVRYEHYGSFNEQQQIGRFQGNATLDIYRLMAMITSITITNMEFNVSLIAVPIYADLTGYLETATWNNSNWPNGTLFDNPANYGSAITFQTYTYNGSAATFAILPGSPGALGHEFNPKPSNVTGFLLAWNHAGGFFRALHADMQMHTGKGFSVTHLKEAAYVEDTP